MRILLSCLQSLKRHPVSAYEHWRTYFVNGCEEAGLECIEVPDVDWIAGAISSTGDEHATWLARTWETVLEFVRREHAHQRIDLFLGYLYPQQIQVTAIKALQHMGIPCVNFFCDNIREFRKVPAEFHCFDLHWVPECQAVGMYRTAGLKYIHAAMPCWVPPQHRTFNHPETEGVTFIGSPDELRRRLLGRAIQLGADIQIYGTGWSGEVLPKLSDKTAGQFLRNQLQHVNKHGLASWVLKFERRFKPLPEPPGIPSERLHGALSPGDLVRVIQRSSVTVGVNRVTTPYRSLRNPITYSRLRDIEAPMLGACYLTEWAQDLEPLYDLGAEIETYRTAEELKKKIDDLLRDPQKRAKLRSAGQRRALGEHSIPKTVGKILSQLHR